MFLAATMFYSFALMAGPAPDSSAPFWGWFGALTYMLDSSLYFLPCGGRSRVCCRTKCDAQPRVQRPLLVATALYLAGSLLDVFIALFSPRISPPAALFSALLWFAAGLGYAYDEMYNETYYLGANEDDTGTEFTSLDDEDEGENI